ncbi:MAG: CRISPR-associated endonuclease Cas3'' [Desulfovibrionaceae bacterium]|nr:CRISPR-associated endonuclease Cas3'' [Desulfovibrionaceae bacterium]
MGDTFFAHSGNLAGDWHPLREHLEGVAHLAQAFAGPVSWAGEALLAGMAHDLGKYPELFQSRLRGQERGLDHWSPGAWVVLTQRQAVAAALAIQGHHIGLQQGLKEPLGRLNPAWLQEHHPLGLRLTDTDMGRIQKRAASDRLDLPHPVEMIVSPKKLFQTPLPDMLNVRMLFSCLVDADFLDTEAHFEGGENGKRFRESGPPLDAPAALSALDRFMDKVRARRSADNAVLDARERLWRMCVSSSLASPGLFTLTAPTGSGKTLAMLKFALEHAARNGLERIVLAVPFLSIIEQTAEIYRAVFKGFPEHYVLEHHSLAGLGIEEAASEAGSEVERGRRLLAENWDAPVVITTNVQLLESLFSNRPSACRKLHNLMRAVILFDEAQTLPQGLVVPTLAALSHLVQGYRSSIVFATATQPAFDVLDGAMRKKWALGWQPTDATPGHVGLYAALKRYEIIWPSPGETTSLSVLADEVCGEEQALCVLNLKRHAEEVTAVLQRDAGEFDAPLHLSTNLCPLHRRAVLETVRARLESGRPCRLVSTQCVEAGVDVDFPAVFRALAPLDAIAQAAGRCNREGGLRDAAGNLRPGQVRVFEPDVEGTWRKRYPTHAYFQATEVTRSLLVEGGSAGLDLHNPEVFREYYRRLYDVGKPEGQNPDFQAAIDGVDFVQVAKLYRLIEKAAIQVLVPYFPRLGQFQELRDEALGQGIGAKWIRRAQGLAVSVYRPQVGTPAWEALIPAKLRHGKGTSDEWYIFEDRNGNGYDEVMGLRLPQSQQILIG